MPYDFARYLRIRSAHNASWSPDGRRISFLTDITGVPQAWEVSADGGWPEQLTFHDNRVSHAEYSPAEERLLFGMDAGGDEKTQLFLLDGGGLERNLTRDPTAIHYSGGFSPDGSRISYTATRRNGTDFDVYTQKSTGEPEMAWETSGYHTVADWGSDGSSLIVSRHHSNLNNDLYSLDLSSGETQLLTPHDGDARFLTARMTPDGGALYLATDRDGDFLRLARLNLSDLELTYLTPDDRDVESVEVSRDGRWLVASRNVEGYSDFMLFSGRGRRAPGPRLPKGIQGGFAFSPDSRRLAFTLTGPDLNPDVWTLDLPDGEPQRLTRSSTAGIPRNSFRRPRLVRYPSFDGRDIPAIFYEPEGEVSSPVVVNAHGGPESQSRPGFAPVTQYLLDRGLGVFMPNVRGSTGYGKAFTHLDDVELRMDSVADLARAAHWLRDQGHERIAVMGGSYGGFMVLAAMTEYPELWSAGVDIVGIANMVTFLENTGSYRRRLREPEYGSLEKDRNFLESISPIHEAERITAPLMVIHGKNDPRVPVGEAEQIVQRVRGNGGVVEYLLYEDEGHGLAKLKNRLDAYPRIAAFLEEHLGARK
ncbi:MAG: S9 family peptidase [Actinomycetota bacterium]|nr:S9 family peptidase [Actinomycetota bacterium]